MSAGRDQKLKVAFFAANVMGVRILEYVLTQPFAIDFIATCKDDFAHTEEKICALAHERNISLLRHAEPNSLNFVENHLRSIDLAIMAWWPNIIKPVAVPGPRVGWLNMHPSLLPIGRGKHGYYWSIVEHQPFGVTLHLIDEGIDTGPILFQKSIETSFLDTGQSLYEKSQDAMYSLFIENYGKICRGEFTAVPQDSAQATFRWGKELLPHSTIDLARTYTGEELLDILRGRTFLQGDSARCEKDGKQYRLKLLIEQVVEKP